MNTSEPGVAETHTSVVFFAGDRAYKLKKPVRFAFIDLSTREARERICHREVELNRRMSPDVYLGVVDLVDETGRRVDHLVAMRRMPAERRLAALLRRGAATDDCVRALARTIAAFHGEAATSDEISAVGAPGAVRALWHSSLDQMQPFASDVLDQTTLGRVRTLALRYVDGRTPLLDARVAGGRIRDGHGDLLTDDIFCLEDGPRILDCIEFDDRLRWGDVVADVAFLAMDLEHLGSSDLAARLWTWYREFSAEAHPETLAHHYVAYRAVVRTKVACLRHRQGEPEAAERAAGLLQLALEHLERGRVRLVLVGGLPGTGKSTLADALADAEGWTVLRSDEIRKELAGLAHDAPSAAPVGHGIYASEMTERTYAELLRRTERLLGLGEPVICDASWNAARHRDAARALAERAAADVHELRCVLPARVAAERIRAAGPVRGSSDASPEVAAAMARMDDPWPGAVAVTTAGSVAETLAAAREALR